MRSQLQKQLQTFGDTSKKFLSVIMRQLFGIGTIANMIFRTFVPVIFLVMASFFLPAMQGDV